MKIPETPANVGAYYGNEENGQWQPNGVIVEGVVGGGDAPAHPPVYPVHVTRHVAGYVMAGAYYPPAPYAPVPQPPPPDDFADYMWMENEEEFDKQVMQQLEEEALMEQCIEAMLEDEQRERTQRPPNSHNTNSSDSSLSMAETVSRSTLNPLAKEFVPTMRPKISHEKPQLPSQTATDPQIASTEESQKTEATKKSEVIPEVTAEVTTEDSKDDDVSSPQATNDTPVVSAAEIVPITQSDRRPKDSKTKPKTELKKVKSDPKVTPKDVKTKATKPTLPVKSDTKVQAPKKKEVKSVKSDVRVEDKVEDLVQAVESTKLSSPAPQTPVTDEPQTGLKPINYAAAAKANKPKKPSVEKTPPPVDKLPSTAVKVTGDKLPSTAVKVTGDKLPSTAVKVTGDKKDKLAASKAPKTEKVIPRKNSTK